MTRTSSGPAGSPRTWPARLQRPGPRSCSSHRGSNMPPRRAWSSNMPTIRPPSTKPRRRPRGPSTGVGGHGSCWPCSITPRIGDRGAEGSRPPSRSLFVPPRDHKSGVGPRAYSIATLRRMMADAGPRPVDRYVRAARWFDRIGRNRRADRSARGPPLTHPFALLAPTARSADRPGRACRPRSTAGRAGPMSDVRQGRTDGHGRPRLRLDRPTRRDQISGRPPCARAWRSGARAPGSCRRGRGGRSAG